MILDGGQVYYAFYAALYLAALGILSCMTGKAPLGVLYVTMQHSLHGVQLGVSLNWR